MKNLKIGEISSSGQKQGENTKIGETWQLWYIYILSEHFQNELFLPAGKRPQG